MILHVKSQNDFLNHFEGLQYVDENNSINRIRNHNKTPIIVDGMVTLPEEKILEIPEELLTLDRLEEFKFFGKINGFDTGKYRDASVEPYVGSLPTDNCFMCEIPKKCEDMAEYNKNVEDSIDCVIYESENFYVVSEKGMLKKGYLMIVTKKHFTAMAEIERAELQQEFEEVCSDVKQILMNSFNGKNVAFIEHGMAEWDKAPSNNSLVHAHMHAIVDFQLNPKEMQKVGMHECENDFYKEYNPKQSYLLYIDGDGKQFIADDPQYYIPSQFIRRMVAQDQGIGNKFDWKEHRFYKVQDESMRDIYDYLSQQKEGRIYDRTKGFVEGYSQRKQLPALPYSYTFEKALEQSAKLKYKDSYKTYVCNLFSAVMLELMKEFELGEEDLMEEGRLKSPKSAIQKFSNKAFSTKYYESQYKHGEDPLRLLTRDIVAFKLVAASKYGAIKCNYDKIRDENAKKRIMELEEKARGHEEYLLEFQNDMPNIIVSGDIKRKSLELIDKIVETIPESANKLIGTYEKMKKDIEQNRVEPSKDDLENLVGDFATRIHSQFNLEVLTQQVHYVLKNSSVLSKMGVGIDFQKSKVTPEGYISNFVTLQTPLRIN